MIYDEIQSSWVNRFFVVSMDVTVVVELASRIQDLVQNESSELLAHGIDLISSVTFIPHLRHLSFRKKGLTSCVLVQL